MQAQDPDAGETLSYSLVAGNDTAAFVLDAASGDLRLADDAAAAEGIYALQVVVTDSVGNQASAVLEVDVQSAPPDNRPVPLLPGDEVVEPIERGVDEDSVDGSASPSVPAPATSTVTESGGSSEATEVAGATGSGSNPETSSATGQSSDVGAAEQRVGDEASGTGVPPTDDPFMVATMQGLTDGFEIPAAGREFAQSSELQRALLQPSSQASAAQSASTVIKLTLRQLSQLDAVRTDALGEMPLEELALSVPLTPEFEAALNGLLNEVEGEARQSDLRVTGAVVGSVSLSAGFVVWVLRAGSLLASALSTRPAWNDLDPLPVLTGDARESDLDQIL